MAAAVVFTRSERFADDKCLRHRGSEHKLKRGRQKSVTWPMDENLCEVRHFLVDDAPAFLGVARQGFFHGKRRSLPFADHVPSNEELSDCHGYHSTEAKRARFTSIANLSAFSVAKTSPVPEVELETSMTIAVPWHHPHEFILDDSWMWAGGDESTEVALQQQRERRLFEAFYPRLSSIPDSPAELLESSKPFDDASLLEIPLIPLEEEETQDAEPEKIIENDPTDNCLPESKAMTDPLKHGSDVSKHPDGICSNPTGESVKCNQSNLMSEADSNIAAVAAAACMVVKALGESDLVDEKLLLEILKNPSLLKSLTWPGQVTKKNKSQVINNDTVSQISLEPITGALGKLLPDQGAYLNASPVSVLTKWEESAITGSPVLVACGSANIQQPAIANLNPVSASPLVASFPSQASHKTHIGKDILQKGFEIATRAVPAICTDITCKPPNVQESCVSHAYKPKDEVRLSCQKGLCNDLPSASSSMQTMPAVTPSISALSTPSSNSEMPRRTLPLRGLPIGRLVQDAESKRLQAKKTVSVPANMGGRAKRFCMYFNSPRGCRNGGSCAFIHQSLDSELNTMAP